MAAGPFSFMLTGDLKDWPTRVSSLYVFGLGKTHVIIILDHQTKDPGNVLLKQTCPSAAGEQKENHEAWVGLVVFIG